MSGRVKLEVVSGPMQGKEFVFEEHDMFLFGRMDDCHACLPDDSAVSRNHFILEANPPDACIRDIGSKNGTYVNGVKHGGREDHETREEGAKRRHPEVMLKNGDRVEVGNNTMLKVWIEGPAVCSQCNKDIAKNILKECAWLGGTFICHDCRNKFVASAQVKAPEPVRCQKCGRDVSDEIGNARRGDYICNSCRAKVEDDPAEILRHILRQAGKKAPKDKDVPAIADYEVEREIARGGFGAVYEARRKKDNKLVAIKLMLSRVAVDERLCKMFLREINNTKKLTHQNIVPLFEHGSAGGAFYFVMELCVGRSVDKLMEKHGGKLNLSEAGSIILQALEGLAYVHAKGFIHRDLKPHNIMLCGSEGSWKAKLGDLGLAKNFQEAGLSGMTMTGSYAGTTVFMPREQVTNYKYVKPVTDVWSMGATFYNMLTGRCPRDSRPKQDPIEVILQGKIVPIRDRDSSIPQKVAEVIDRCLNNNIKERYQDAGEMRKALAKVL